MMIVSAPLLLGAAQATGETIVGDWSNAGRSVTVRIAACGENLCGQIVEASEEAKLDALKAGTENLVGTQVLTGFAPAGPGRWRGTLFVPDKALTTRARILRIGPDELQLIACDRTGLICRKQI
jgi:uncharacterized protein (DUF2147 family)